ncbi:MAG: methyltransferase domain-containing protein [Planctomycetes bacterium]|nr:methyltransferase domain-containing protein [Planctomycetota bacterium]
MTDPARPFDDSAGVPNRGLGAHEWDARWTAKDTPWDMAAPTPPLARALRDGLVKPPGRAIVLGCGAGHDARAVAAAGFDTTGVDFSPAAVALAREIAAREQSSARFEQADVFALPGHLHGADLVVEHTLFCAVDPSLRDRYVDAIAYVLRPGGRLLALFWLIRTETGPPFGSNEPEIRHRFARRFRFAHAERPTDSAPARPHEMLCVLERL